MKYKLINELGNVVKETDSERKRERLLNLGYKDYEVKENEIDRMTVSELDKFAKEKNIDISNCRNKEEKISFIKATIN